MTQRGIGNYVIQLADGRLIQHRHKDRIETIDSKYVQYAHRYTRKLARQIARELGGEVLRVNEVENK